MAVTRAPRTKFIQAFVHLRERDWTVLDVDEAMAIMPEESNDTAVDMDRDPIAILIIEWRGDDRMQRWIAKLADALQSLLYLPRLPTELMGVSHVLITASSAAAEIRTARRCPMRGGMNQPNEFGLSEGFFLSNNLGCDVFVFDHERHKDRFAIDATDAFPAESNVFDRQLNLARHGSI